MAEERKETPPSTTNEGRPQESPGPEPVAAAGPNAASAGEPPAPAAPASPATDQAPSRPASEVPGEPAAGPAAANQQAEPTATDQEDAAPAAEPAADIWAPIDAVLQGFAAERPVAPGTFWGENPTEVEGRFVGWANASGWRCTLQLVLAPQENVVVLVAQGPPLPGGRARMMVLGAFPPDFDQPTLHAALEVGYSIGETWGPADEPPPAPPTPPADQAPEESAPTS